MDTEWPGCGNDECYQCIDKGPIVQKHGPSC